MNKMGNWKQKMNIMGKRSRSKADELERKKGQQKQLTKVGLQQQILVLAKQSDFITK
jgi:hypothetical protein